MFRLNKEAKEITAVETATTKKFSKQALEISDLNQLISDFPEYKDAASFANTFRFLYHNRKNDLVARKLAHYVVVEPNEDKVIAILNSNPLLINTVIPVVIDTAGRQLIRNTIFQLAYGAGDVEMCLAIKRFFIQVYGSEEAAIEKMEEQRNAKFAEDKEADANKEKEAKNHFAALLQPAIAATAAEPFNLGQDPDGRLILSQATLTAIETFREKFTKSQLKRVEKGMHFRNNTLQETLDACRQVLKTSNGEHNIMLFRDGIVSYVLLAVPANDAQKFSQGIAYIEPCMAFKFARSFALRVGKNNFYLTCRDKSREFSLVGSCVDIALGIRSATHREENFSHDISYYQFVCKTKTSSFQSLFDMPSQTRSLGV
jgi:hypothetical protein